MKSNPASLLIVPLERNITRYRVYKVGDRWLVTSERTSFTLWSFSRDKRILGK